MTDKSENDKRRRLGADAETLESEHRLIPQTGEDAPGSTRRGYQRANDAGT